MDNSGRDVCNRERDPLIGLDGAGPHAHDPATHRQRSRRRRGPERTRPARQSGTIAPGSWYGDAPAVSSGRVALGSSCSRRDGLEASQVGVRVLHPRGSHERPRSGRGGDCGGAAALERRGGGQDPADVAPPGELHVPGSNATTVGRPAPGPRLLVGVIGLGRSASPASASVDRDNPSLGIGPHGPTDEGLSGLARRGATGPRGASRGLACEQPGGMRQQCGADAASATPEDDAGCRGPQTPVLEPTPLSSRPPQGSDPVRRAAYRCPASALGSRTRIVRTGQGASRTIRSATEPSSTWLSPVRP